LHAAGVKRRLVFISSMGIYGQAPGEQYRSILDPYRDSAAVTEASDLDYTTLRPSWATYDMALNSLSDLIVRLGVNPGMERRRSLGVSRA
jgi:hypothetical protein